MAIIIHRAITRVLIWMDGPVPWGSLKESFWCLADDMQPKVKLG